MTAAHVAIARYFDVLVVPGATLVALGFQTVFPVFCQYFWDAAKMSLFQLIPD
jgi:hypothetical protein